MIFLAVTLATFWAWEFLDAYATWIPGYVAHFLVPLMAAGMFFLPHLVVLAMASTALVGLLHRFMQRWIQQSVQLPRTVRRSNIPPPP